MNIETPEAVRPPVALGCFIAAAVVVAIVGFLVFAVIFLESGADTGTVRLDVPEAYAEGSVEFVGAKNFFLVRLRDGSFLALSDLDAANRANQAQRCRVQLTPVTAASLGVTAEQLRSQMSPAASGANAVLAESCNGAIYDIAGTLLGAEGPNLDRHPVRVGDDGHLVVETRTRECSVRSRASIHADVDCP